MVDLDGYTMKKRLQQKLNIPYVDVDIALSMTRPLQITNAHWYRETDAARALEAFYLRRIEENRVCYETRHTELYRKRMDIYTQRLERIRAWKDTLPPGMKAVPSVRKAEPPGPYMFIRILRKSALTPQQKQTLRGQALNGDLDGAMRGYDRLLRETRKE